MSRKLRYLFRLFSGKFHYRWQHLNHGVYCFTYHRIGNDQDAIFDPNVFSCTAQQFEKHLLFLKQNFEVISSEQLLSLVNTQQTINKRYALISFDDGYLDNYDIALPLLLKHKLPAIFFITTNFIAQKSIPWWDEIAWMLKHSQHLELTVGINDLTFSLPENKNPLFIHQMLNAIKADTRKTMDEKIHNIAQQLAISFEIRTLNKPLFMNWSQVKAMQQAGMDIGGHTVSHPILSHLSEDAQRQELAQSKTETEQQLAKPLSCFAYPVGAYHCYNESTKKILNDLGFKLAFTYEPGINHTIDRNNRFDLQRFPIEINKSIHRLKYNICFPESTTIVPRI